MRYLKKFNESDDVKRDGFQLESEGLLSYFIDEHHAGVAVIFCDDVYENVYISASNWVRWKDCKDDIIPYINYIKDKYEFETIVGRFANSGNIRFATKDKNDDTTFYMMMNDIESLDDSFEFWEIYFKVRL